jgi:hypothetical protein
MKAGRLLALLLALPTSPAYATPPADAEKLVADVMAFVSKPEHRQIVASTATQAFKIFQQCDSGAPGPAAKPLFYGMLARSASMQTGTSPQG